VLILWNKFWCYASGIIVSGTETVGYREVGASDRQLIKFYTFDIPHVFSALCPDHNALQP